MQRPTIRSSKAVLIAGAVATIVWVSAGSLAPPAGSINATMKDLDDVEPRAAIRNDFDTPAPIVISESGSYYLAEDIRGFGGAAGIQITAPNVTLDLNGSTIYGNLEVLSLDGVRLEPAADGAAVRNGRIQDFGGNGIGTDASGAEETTVENVVVSNNGLGGNGFGVWLTIRARVRNCKALENVRGGIRVGRTSMVSGCLAVQNGSTGIFADDSSVIADCNAYQNDGGGISTITGAIVRNSSAALNGEEGISVFAGTVTGCNARENTEEGILAPGSLIHGCTSTGNTGVNFSGGTLVDNHP